jgi:hypothetical protein
LGEAWSLTPREEHRLRVCEYKVLKRVFGAKREEVAGGWRRLHNEELHKLYASSSIVMVIKSRRFRPAGRVSCVREMRNVYKFFIGKPK